MKVYGGLSRCHIGRAKERDLLFGTIHRRKAQKFFNHSLYFMFGKRPYYDTVRALLV